MKDRLGNEIYIRGETSEDKTARLETHLFLYQTASHLWPLTSLHFVIHTRSIWTRLSSYVLPFLPSMHVKEIFHPWNLLDSFVVIFNKKNTYRELEQWLKKMKSISTNVGLEHFKDIKVSPYWPWLIEIYVRSGLGTVQWHCLFCTGWTVQQ